jgi:hypothetical protein
MQSYFTDKSAQPTEQELENALGESYHNWVKLRNHLTTSLPQPGEEWNYPGKKYGWSFRMRSKKRNIIYFIPGNGFFKIALVFGDKAVNKIMESDLPDSIKSDLREARKYVEGRGISLDVKDQEILPTIIRLAEFKLKN